MRGEKEDKSAGHIEERFFCARPETSSHHHPPIHLHKKKAQGAPISSTTNLRQGYHRETLNESQEAGFHKDHKTTVSLQIVLLHVRTYII